MNLKKRLYTYRESPLNLQLTQSLCRGGGRKKKKNKKKKVRLYTYRASLFQIRAHSLSTEAVEEKQTTRLKVHIRVYKAECVHTCMYIESM